MRFRIKDFEYVFPEEKLKPSGYTPKEVEKIFFCGLLEMHKRKAMAELKAGKKKPQVKKALDAWHAPGKTPKERSLEAHANKLKSLPPDELETIMKLAGKSVAPAPATQPPRNRPSVPVAMRTEDTLTQDTPAPPVMDERQRRAAIAKARAMVTMGGKGSGVTGGGAIPRIDAAMNALTRKAFDDDDEDLRGLVIPE